MSERMKPVHSLSLMVFYTSKIDFAGATIHKLRNMRKGRRTMIGYSSELGAIPALIHLLYC